LHISLPIPRFPDYAAWMQKFNKKIRLMNYLTHITQIIFKREDREEGEENAKFIQL